MKENDLNRPKLFIYVFLAETCYVKRKHMKEGYIMKETREKKKRNGLLMRSHSTFSL